jgi:hypothetical protein
MKKLLTSVIAIGLLASCTSHKTYTFKSVKTGYTYDEANYQNVNHHKIGDTVTMPYYLGEPNGFKTVDVILISIK